MPVGDCGFRDADGVPGSQTLVLRGPTLAVDIGFDPNFDSTTGAVPKAAAQQIPALIDTGATESCIDDDLAVRLNLPLVDRQVVSGVGGRHELSMYLAQVAVPVFGYVQYGSFAGVKLLSGGQPHQALLGRTFLRNFLSNCSPPIMPALAVACRRG